MTVKNCVCVCPFHSTVLSDDEKLSLNRFVQVMYTYDIVFCVPKSLNINDFIKNITENNSKKYLQYHESFVFEYFDDNWFKSNHTYSSMLLTLDFYNRFIDYRYMFIHQLDSFIFENKLDYYLSKNYNFIGAYEGPLFMYDNLFDNFNNNDYNNYLNGGFSLRNIDYCINVINNKFTEAQYIIDNNNQYIKAEDQFFCESLNQYMEMNDLLRFSLSNPHAELIFGLTHLYPFGCHGYNKSKFLISLINKYINEHNITILT